MATVPVRRFGAGWLCAALLLPWGASCHDPPDWPLMRCDEARSGRSPHRGARSGRLKWTFEPKTPFFVESDPVIGRDGTVLFLDREIGGDGTRRLDAVGADGRRKWHYGGIPSDVGELGVDREGNIYFGTEAGTVYAVDADGELRWTHDLGGAVWGAPLISGDTVYLGATDGSFTALGRTGALRWSYTAEGSIRTSAAMDADGVIYVGDSAGVLHALDSAGARRWQVSLGDPIAGPVAVGPNGAVYALARGRLYAVDLQGAVQWTVYVGEPSGTQAVAIGVEGILYVNGEAGEIVAVTSLGRVAWRQEGEAGSTTTLGPLIVDQAGDLYYGYMVGCIGMGGVKSLGLDGMERWSVFTVGVTRSLAIARDGTTYALTGGVLYAFE